MESGEKRMLLSTTQADYLRQWLYATGLVAAPLPLPDSSCVLTSARFPIVAQELFRDPNAFKDTQKVLPMIITARG
jgi:hypothetical protein